MGSDIGTQSGKNKKSYMNTVGTKRSSMNVQMNGIVVPAMGTLDPDEKQAADWSDEDDEPILPIGRRPEPDVSPASPITLGTSAPLLNTVPELPSVHDS